MYYNLKRKMLYIEWLEKSGTPSSGVSNLFNVAEDIERQYDLDLCELPLEAVQSIVNT